MNFILFFDEISIISYDLFLGVYITQGCELLAKYTQGTQIWKSYKIEQVSQDTLKCYKVVFFASLSLIIQQYYVIYDKFGNLFYCFRRCLNNQVFLLQNDSHPYCKGACEEKTLCGEVIVPDDHLNVWSIN